MSLKKTIGTNWLPGHDSTDTKKEKPTNPRNPSNHKSLFPLLTIRYPSLPLRPRFEKLASSEGNLDASRLMKGKK